MGFFRKKFGYKEIFKQICSFPELIESNTEAIEGAYSRSDIDELQRKNLLRMIAACKSFESEWQKEKSQEILDAYIKFDYCLKKAPKSKAVKPEFICASSFEGELKRKFEYCEKVITELTLYSKFVNNQRVQNFGIRIKEKKLLLFPTVPDTTNLFDSQRDPGYLLHVGTLIYFDKEAKRRVDILKNMKMYGVFGNTDADCPTYLQKAGAKVAGYGSHFVANSLKVTLFVNKEKLLEKRNVFVDPESVRCLERNPPTGDIIGNSYIVFGGIPHESIEDFKIERDNPLVI